MARRGDGSAGDPMTTALGDALEAFILEHEYCGELDTLLRGRGSSDI